MNIHFDKEIPAYDEEKMMKTIEASKKEYRKHMLSEPMSGWEFLFQQMLYLSKTYWLSQLMVFLIAAFSLGFMNPHENKITYCAIFAPLLIIFSIPELWKNISNNSYEVEGTTYFDLRKVYFSRLVLVGMLDLLLTTILIGITVKTSSFSPYEAIIYFFVPFNINCCICFSLLCSRRKICSEFLAVCSCLSGTIFWYLLVKHFHVYELLQIKLWYVLLFISVMYLIFAGKRFIETSKCYVEVFE